MDPITAAGVSVGILTNLLSDGLGALIAEAAKDPERAKARPPQDLDAMLAAPAAQLARKLSATDPAQHDRLQQFLRSNDVDALVKRLFRTRVTAPEGDAMSESRDLFRALHATSPGLTGSSEQADALFDALLDACEASVQAAIDRNLLPAHDAMSALRHRQTHEQLNRIETKLENGFDTPAAGRQPNAPAPTPAEPPGSMPPGVLAIGLTPNADGGTRLDYHLSGATPAPRHWDAAETAALRRAATGGDGAHGERLFDRLFGAWPGSAELFRALFAEVDAPQPSPIHKQASLRIVTDDPELLRLPWGRLAWQGRRLIDCDWDIVTAAEPLPRQRCQTQPAAELLVVTDPAPPSDRRPPAARRVALTTLLADQRPAKPARVREVTDAGALAEALRHPPHALFIELACDEQDGQPLLLFGSDPPQRYPLVALEAALLRAEPAPCLLVLALRGAAAVELMARLSALLGHRLALILSLAPAADPAATDPARETLLRLLPAWLRNGDDPVQALHRLLRAAPSPLPRHAAAADLPPCDPGLIGIRANYRDWQTVPFDHDRDNPPPLRALDRDDQKAKVAEHVRKLARRSRDRVLMIVAYGSPENLVAELSDQLLWHLETSISGKAALAGERIGLPEIALPLGKQDLPAAIDRLHNACEPHLKETLRAAQDEKLGELIRRHVPKGLDRGERAVLWLDWGHIRLTGDDAANATDLARVKRLASAALYALPRWCAERLNSDCPEGLRVVCILGLEVPEAQYPVMNGKFERLRQERWHNRSGFRLLPLEPLGEVDEDHLHEYLTEIDTGLGDEAREDLVNLILADTGRVFNATVRLLEEGRDIGWRPLREKLEDRHRPAKASQPEELF